MKEPDLDPNFILYYPNSLLDVYLISFKGSKKARLSSLAIARSQKLKLKVQSVI